MPAAGLLLPSCDPDDPANDVGATTRAPLSEPTEVLLQRVCLGDEAAREKLLRRFLPLLRQWAHGRLPGYARDLNETDDLVQIAVIKALKHVEQFVSEGPGSFLAFLRQILLNQVRDEIRRCQRRPRSAELDPELVDPANPSPVEQIAGKERLEAYERALAALPKRQQGLIIMRLEFGMSYSEIAAEVGSKTDAVRIMIARALVTLSQSLQQV